MRLPWPFGRSSAAPAETGSSIDGAPEPALAPGPPETGRPTGAWSTLPPIQRVSGEPPVVAPARAFLHDVPGANPLPPIVGQLGHDVTPLAPAGLVSAPVHAVPSLTSGASFVDRPLQRRTPDGVAAASSDPFVQSAAATAPTTTPAPVTPTPAPTSDPVGNEPAAAAAGTPPPSAHEPVRHLSVVADGAAASTPARSLTRAGAWTPPAAAGRPLVQRTNVQASAQSASTAPISAHASDAPPLASAAMAAGAPASAADKPAGADSTPRRAGLGAPLASAPTTAVQRSPAPSSSAHGPATGQRSGGPSLPLNPTVGAAPLHATVQRRGAAARAAATAGAEAPAPAPLERAGSRQAPYVGRPVTGGLPSLPVVSRSATAQADRAAASDHDEGDDADHGGSEPPHRAIATTTPASTLPLASTAIPAPSGSNRPATTTAIQRASSSAPAPATAASAADRRPLVGAHPLRPTAATDSSTGRDAAYESGTPAGATAPAPYEAGVAAALALSGAALPQLQRSMDSAAGSYPTPPGAGALAGLPPAATVQASRGTTPTMALARSTTGAQLGGATPNSTTIHFPAVTSGVIPGITATPPSPPAVQTQAAAAAASAPVLAPTITANVQRIDGSPPPAPEPDRGRSESELEELARALFPKFQRQLRMEYVYEREARGVPFDT